MDEKARKEESTMKTTTRNMLTGNHPAVFSCKICVWCFSSSFFYLLVAAVVILDTSHLSSSRIFRLSELKKKTRNERN